jgi:hypothetical protein
MNITPLAKDEMTSIVRKRHTLILFLVLLSGCYSEAIPEITYNQGTAELIKFSECKWIRLNLICVVENLTGENIPQRSFTISALGAKGTVVFKELIKTPIDTNSTVEKWFESFKSRERVVKLIVEKNI